MACLKDRMADMRKMDDELGITIDLMQRMYGVMQQLTDTTHHLAADTHEMTHITDELRDHIADFDDFWSLRELEPTGPVCSLTAREFVLSEHLART